MRCEDIEPRMANVLAGEAAPGDRAALDHHFVACSDCREDFEHASAAARASWPDEPVPGRLVAKARAAWTAPLRRLRFLRAVTGLAAAFCVAVLAFQYEIPEDVRPEVPPAEPPAPVLAFVEPASIGSLVAKDMEGRPVGVLGLKSHSVSVEILDGIARTTIEENFENHTGRRLEGTFVFPLPSDASISRLALEVNGKIEEGTVLERERAREVFETIVRKMKDPALLEWMPGGLFKCRVFPIEPHATKRVIVAYTQALPVFDGRMTYVYPMASEKTRAHPPETVSLEVDARFAGTLTRVVSPSHGVDVQRPDGHRARAAYRASKGHALRDFVLTLETSDEEVRMATHRKEGEDGYFALFLTPQGGGERKPGRFAFVLDVSATVSEAELEIARRLVRAMMERGVEGDRFEILAHHVDVTASGPVDPAGAEAFMKGLRREGASDVLAALRAAPEGSEIIYIGEGQATIGETDPARIAEAVAGFRIRSVGVGRRANVALLQRLGSFIHVSPDDSLGGRVRQIADTFGRPVLKNLRMEHGGAFAAVTGLRDVHFGERLVVLGRYSRPTADVVVTGDDYRKAQAFDLPAEDSENGWIRRLWARRTISDLLAQGGKEAEVVRLGVDHQIVTPYTSFLVLESEKMWKDYRLDRVVQKQDELLGKTEEGSGDEIRRLLQEGTELYKHGRYEAASSRFEEAFQMKPNSDQVYAFIKRAGEDLVAGMMNSPDRKMQDSGRRLFELAKPGTPLREGKETVRKYLEDLKSGSHEVWRNSFFHLKNFGPHAVKDIIPALGDQQNDRFRARAQLLLTEMGVDASLAVAEALESDDPFVRQQAAIVLGNVKDERTLPALAKRLEDPNERPEVKKFVQEALRKIDRNGGDAEGLQGRLDAANAKLTKVHTDQEVFVRQLESQLDHVQGLTSQVEEHRQKLAVALNAKSLAVAEMQYARQMAERLQQDLAELEGRHLELARSKKHLEEKLNHLNHIGVRTDVSPKKPLEGKVTAVANEIGLVVISIGKDEGVLEGDEFTVYRGGDFVAKIVIDRADRKWAAGKVVLKKQDPRVADDVSNHIFVTAPRGSEDPVAPKPLQVVEVEERSGTVTLNRWLQSGTFLAIQRDSSFVAVVLITETARNASFGKVWGELAVGKIRPEDRAEVVTDLVRFMSSMPEDVRRDAGSKANLDRIRSRMRMEK